jgi:hypothetical protein
MSQFGSAGCDLPSLGCRSWVEGQPGSMPNIDIHLTAAPVARLDAEDSLAQPSGEPWPLGIRCILT